MRNKMNQLIDNIIEHVGILSIFAGLVMTIVCFHFPVNKRELLSHVITYSSCNLALIGFIFSILLDLRGGGIYTKLMSRFPNSIRKVYRTVFRITVASSFCVILSLFIIGFQISNKLAKYIFSFCICTIFAYMFVGTLAVFQILIQLLISEIQNPKTKGSP